METLSDKQKKNVYLIKREFIREMDKGLGKIKKSISRTYSGLLTNIPSNIFYYVYFRGKVRENVLNQIKICLRMAIDYDSTNLDELIEKYKVEYLHNDLISIHCKKDHPLFSELQEITINNLYSRIPILHTLIDSEGETYNELVSNAFKSESDVHRVLEIQMIFIDQWIDILADNKDILLAPKIINVPLPISKEAVFKVILETYEYGLQRLEEKMEHFFPKQIENGITTGGL